MSRFDDALVNRTLELLASARRMADRGEIPPPLEDSPECPRCSLVGICLPDEVAFLNGSDYVVKPDGVRRVRVVAPDAALKEMSRLSISARSADSLQTLLGIEGAAASVYFSNFGDMIRSEDAAFDFARRSRRPPKDPVNAVLSLLYSMLIKQCLVSDVSVGFDQYTGFYHSPSTASRRWRWTWRRSYAP